MADLIDRAIGGTTLEESVKALQSVFVDHEGYSTQLYKTDYERGKQEEEAEIIRCRDCKYYNPEKDEESWSSEACNHPLLDASDPYECYVLRVSPDDFCSRGERRTDEDNKM